METCYNVYMPTNKKKKKKKSPGHRAPVAYQMIVAGPRSTRVPNKRRQASRLACRGRVEA